MNTKNYLTAFNNQLIIAETNSTIAFIASRATIKTILDEAQIKIKYSGTKYHNSEPIYFAEKTT